MIEILALIGTTIWTVFAATLLVVVIGLCVMVGIFGGVLAAALVAYAAFVAFCYLCGFVWAMLDDLFGAKTFRKFRDALAARRAERVAKYKEEFKRTRGGAT